MPLGDGRHRLFINGQMREAAGVDVGSLVGLELERDPEPRRLQVPGVLAEALSADAAAKLAWEELTPFPSPGDPRLPEFTETDRFPGV